MTKCPHDNVMFCPLNLANHIGHPSGCDDGQLGTGRCAVSRGINYEKAVAIFAIAYPRDVAELEWKKQQADAFAQRQRNMRLLRIH